MDQKELEALEHYQRELNRRYHSVNGTLEQVMATPEWAEAVEAMYKFDHRNDALREKNKLAKGVRAKVQGIVVGTPKPKAPPK